jgi:sulfite reductase (NADPH) hemoprotein beta-component
MLGKILTASDLRRGDVVFLTPEGWVRDHRRACVAASPDEAASLLAIGRKALAANLIVDPYLIEVAPDGAGVPEPVHYRERFRLSGPTVAPVLAPPAEPR